MAKKTLYTYEGFNIDKWGDIQKIIKGIASNRQGLKQKTRLNNTESIAWFAQEAKEHQFLAYAFQHDLLYKRHVRKYGIPLNYGINSKSLKDREDRSIYVLFDEDNIISFRAERCKLKPKESNINTYKRDKIKRACRQKISGYMSEIKRMSTDPITETIHCPYCRQRKNKNCIEIDHTDRTFSMILREFEDYLIDLGYPCYPTLLVPNFVGNNLSPNAVYPVFLDKNFQELWIDFHEKHANLTIKCRDCHQAKTLSEGDHKRRSNLQLPVDLAFYTGDCWDDYIKSHPDIAV